MTREYRAEQTVCISASESGDELEILMVVNFIVHPGSKQTMIDPAEEPTAEVDRIQFFNISNGKPLPNPIALPVWLINSLTDGAAFHDWLLSEAEEDEQFMREQDAEARRDEVIARAEGRL